MEEDRSAAITAGAEPEEVEVLAAEAVIRAIKDSDDPAVESKPNPAAEAVNPRGPIEGLGPVENYKSTADEDSVQHGPR